MFDWLFEGRPSVYLLFGAAAFAYLALWYRNQKKKRRLRAAAVCVVLACFYAGLDWAVETDREQVRHRVEEMAAAVCPRVGI